MAIKTFKQKWLEDFYYNDIKTGIQPQLRDRVFRKLKLIDYATCLEDLRSLPENKLHPLTKERKEQWAIAVSGPWQLGFYFENSEACELELVQYH